MKCFIAAFCAAHVFAPAVWGDDVEVYDWQNGRYLDLTHRGHDRFEVYDWQEHT